MRAQRSNIVQASDGSGVAGNIFAGLFNVATAGYRAKVESEDFIQKQDYLHGHRKDLINTEYDRRDSHAKVKGHQDRVSMTHDRKQKEKFVDAIVARPTVRQAFGVTTIAGTENQTPGPVDNSKPEPKPKPKPGPRPTPPSVTPPLNNPGAGGYGKAKKPYQPSLPGFSLNSMKAYQQTQNSVVNSGKKK